MIHRAIIEKIEDNFTARIRIPWLDKSADNPIGTKTQDLSIAKILTLPGMTCSYQEGDLVLVGFENDEVDLPIILGLLQSATFKSNSTIGIVADTLKVTTECRLPDNTAYIDDYTEKLDLSSFHIIENN